MVWRLKDLPTGDEVAALVEQGVLSKDEAREILLRDEEEENKDEKVKALKEQIEFLQKVVDALTRRQYTTITYTPTHPTVYWQSWGGTLGGGVVNCYAASTGSSTVNTVSLNTGNLLK